MTLRTAYQKQVWVRLTVDLGTVLGLALAIGAFHGLWSWFDVYHLLERF